ncbi:glycine cleavage system protein GcvH [bacterium]|nr:glycine cleavage system protein GcvH [bacterium]
MKCAVLVCSGLDKPWGSLAREVALGAAEQAECEIVCPVLLSNSPNRYKAVLQDLPLAVVDGCRTRCATKLATSLGLKISRRLLLQEALKGCAEAPGDSLRPGPGMQQVALKLALELVAEEAEPGPAPEVPAASFPDPIDFLRVTHDKFVFAIPKEGYLFNENDCWVQVSGNRARVGISDYMQQSLTDITFFDPPEVGREVEQFDDLGGVESAKAVFDLISPVGGKVVAVNAALEEAPELINEHPYTDGWLVELELADFEADQELLLGSDDYAVKVKQKAEEASS